MAFSDRLVLSMNSSSYHSLSNHYECNSVGRSVVGRVHSDLSYSSIIISCDFERVLGQTSLWSFSHYVMVIEQIEFMLTIIEFMIQHDKQVSRDVLLYFFRIFYYKE